VTAAQKTAQRLSDAAASQQALPVAANEAFRPIDKALDPAQDGKYPSNVNGQDSQQPVDKFGQPLLVTESPSSIALASQTTTTFYAGRHLHGTAQADWHLAAGNVIAAAAAKGVSLFAQAAALPALPVSANAPNWIEMSLLGYLTVNPASSIVASSGKTSREERFQQCYVTKRPILT